MDAKTVKKNRTVKFIWYVAGKLVVLLIVIVLAIFALNTARNSSEIFMLVKDGFVRRNSAILGTADEEDVLLLSGIFSDEYLKESGLENYTANASYNIKGYDERTSVPVTVVWAWKNTAKIRVTNIVQDISAEVNENMVAEFHAVEEFIESGIYTVHCAKDSEGNWQIVNIVLEERIEIDESHQREIPTPEVVGGYDPQESLPPEDDSDSSAGWDDDNDGE